jgi:hypothetical protein
MKRQTWMAAVLVILEKGNLNPSDSPGGQARRHCA